MSGILCTWSIFPWWFCHRNGQDWAAPKTPN